MTAERYWAAPALVVEGEPMSRGFAKIAFLTLAAACACADATEYFVSPTGSDAAPGSKDQPFATLARARDAIRAMRGANVDELPKPVTVHIRGGTYHMTEPLRLLPEDSGTVRCPVAYEAFKDEKPVISGGKPVVGWRKGNGGYWVAQLPGVAQGGWHFHQLFSKRAGQDWFERRYLPSRGLLVIAGLTDAPHRDPDGPINHRNPQKEVYFDTGDIERWQNLADVELLFMHDWSSGRMHIADLDLGESIVRFTEFPHYRIGHWYPGGRNPYLVENLKEAFGKPGEWYLDRPTGSLMYTPLPDEDMGTTTFITPRVERLIIAEGDLAANRYVENVRFRGLTFAHTAWLLPPHLYAEEYGRACRQGFVDMPAAVEFKAARHCRIERCAFTNLGSYALDLGDGCHENAVVGSLMYDLGTGGIKVGTVDREASFPKLPTGNTIENNVISNAGLVHYSGHGIWGGMCARTKVRHNVVTRTLYSSVAVGWSHSKTPTGCRENLIECNHVYDVMLLLDHGAAIYTLGNQTGTVIRGNLVHDTHQTWLHGKVARPVWAGGALGFDDGSSDFTVEQNILYNTPADPALPLTSGRARDMNIGVNYCGIKPGDKGFPAELAARAGLEPAYRDLLDVRYHVVPPPVLSMALPESLKPTVIVDTFDKVAVNRPSRRAYCRVEDKAPGKGTDSIAVTDETSAKGGRSLKVVDAPGLSREWIPYVSYAPRYNAGVATVGFCLRLEPGAVMEYCWRGKHPTREFSVGPSVSFRNGELSLPDGTKLAIPMGQWVKLKTTARLGEFDPGIGRAGEAEHGLWTLDVALPDGTVRSFKGMKHVDKEFKDLSSVMFISTATERAVFYLDEVRISAD